MTLCWEVYERRQNPSLEQAQSVSITELGPSYQGASLLFISESHFNFWQRKQRLRVVTPVSELGPGDLNPISLFPHPIPHPISKW